jgi:hypothetical protein
MPCQKGVMLMLLHTEIPTVTFGSMNTNNAHLSNQISLRIQSLVNQPFVCTPDRHNALEIFSKV